MTLSEKQKTNIIGIMQRMTSGQVELFSDYLRDERTFILDLIINQRGCMFETNGTATLPETITKFKRLSA